MKRNLVLTREEFVNRMRTHAIILYPRGGVQFFFYMSGMDTFVEKVNIYNGNEFAAYGLTREVKDLDEVYADYQQIYKMDLEELKH